MDGGSSGFHAGTCPAGGSAPRSVPAGRAASDVARGAHGQRSQGVGAVAPGAPPGRGRAHGWGNGRPVPSSQLDGRTVPATSHRPSVAGIGRGIGPRAPRRGAAGPVGGTGDGQDSPAADVRVTVDTAVGWGNVRWKAVAIVAQLPRWWGGETYDSPQGPRVCRKCRKADHTVTIRHPESTETRPGGSVPTRALWMGACGAGPAHRAADVGAAGDTDIKYGLRHERLRAARGPRRPRAARLQSGVRAADVEAGERPRQRRGPRRREGGGAGPGPVEAHDDGPAREPGHVSPAASSVRCQRRSEPSMGFAGASAASEPGAVGSSRVGPMPSGRSTAASNSARVA